MEKLSCPTDIQLEKKRKITGVTPKLYKPFKQSLAELDVPAGLRPLIKDSIQCKLCNLIWSCVQLYIQWMCIMQWNVFFKFIYPFFCCQKHVLNGGHWTMCSANVIMLVNCWCWLNMRGAVTATSGRLFQEMSWYSCYFHLTSIFWNLKKNIKIN